MTTNVTIKNTVGHQAVKVSRRFPSTGAETELATIESGKEQDHISVWDDCELVIREVAQAPTPATGEGA